MSIFEQQILGEIPMHEAASFFVGMKLPVSREAQVKTAAVKMKSAAQHMIDDLLAGKTPAGKAGHFKPVNEIKEAAARMKTAAAKLGFAAAGTGDPEANMQGGQPTPAASNLPSMPQPGASMAPPAGPVQDPEAAKPSTEATIPANYMGAELLARAAQHTNETGFLRERLNAATEQNNALNQQLQSIQGQLDEVNTTQQAAGDQVMQATNEAVSASTRALEHSMQAANMRIGIQKMREAMMELASQDPESMGTLSQQQQVQDEASMQQQQGAVDAGAGAPGQTPTPPTGSGVPAAGAGEEGEGGPEEGGKSETSSPTGGKGTSVNIKTGGIPGGAVIPGAIAGAGLGAFMSHRSAKGVDESRAQVEGLESAQEQEGGSFSKALELARAKQQLASNELAAKHPVQHGVRSALLGGVQGGFIGAGLNQLGQSIQQQGLPFGKTLVMG